MGEILLVGRVPGDGLARQLVGPREQQCLGERLQVVLRFSQVARQRREQRFVGGRVGRAQVVERFHQATAKIVRPKPVRNRRRQKRIGRRCHPLGQRHPAILGRGEGLCRRAERPGGHRLRAAGLLGDLRSQINARLPDDRLGAAGQGLFRQSREHPGQRPVIVLAPAFRRMVVAFRALDPHTEKHLADRPGRDLRRAERLVQRGRSLGGRGTFCGDNLSHHRIVRAVLGKLPADPAGHRHRPLRGHGILVHLQNVRPFHRPKVGIFRTLQQAVDQSGAFVGRGVGQKRPGLPGRGQRADGVEEDAPDKFRIVRRGARRDPQAFEFVPDMAVDKVVFRRSRETHPRSRQRHPANGHVTHVPDKDGGFARFVAGADQAPGVGAGDRAGVGVVFGLGGHAAPGTVGRDGGDPQLLRRTQRQDPLTGFRLDGDHRGDGRAFVAGALAKPAEESPVSQAVLVDFLAAPVRDRAGRLGKEKATGRGGRENPPAPRVVHNRLVVAGRVEPKHAQLETGLTLGLAVATAAVARRLGQDRDDLLFERHPTRRFQTADFHGNANGLAGMGDSHLGPALGFWRDHAGRIDGGDRLVGYLVSGGARGIRGGQGGEQLLGRFRTLESHDRRGDHQRGAGGRKPDG